jgi:hypothetical protein
MTQVPIDERILLRNRALEFYSYDGLIRNVGSERLVYIALLKELIDNALDAEARSIEISLKETENQITISVANDGETFLGKAIYKAFTSFDSFTSTKFRKLLSRGSLGNALKVVSGAPIALAEKFQQSKPETLLTISTQEGSFKVTRPERLADSDPIVEPTGGKSSKTEITLSVHYRPSKEHYDLGVYTRFLLVPGYFLFNPWVKFDFSATRNEVDVRYESNALEPTHKLKRPSIHWYSLADLESLVRELAESIHREGPLTVRNLVSDFRGLSAPESQITVLQSAEVEDISLLDLNGDHEKIQRLYLAMKSTTTPPPADLLEYLGKERICKTLNEIFPGEPLEQFFYEKSRKTVTIDDYQVPYVIEVAVAKLQGSRLYQFYGLNYSPFLMEFPWHQSAASGIFSDISWEWKPKKGQKGKAESYSEFLEQFHLKQGEGAVIIVHILCPNLKVRNLAKSKYDFSPLSDDLVQLLYRCCKNYEKARAPKGTAAIVLLIEELVRRQQLLNELGHIPQEEWTTQQAIYYKIRTRMGGNVGMKRKNFIKAILRECSRLGEDRSYRETLGIKAAVRAQFFHRGREEPVAFDTIGTLSEKGSDLLLIEKEGVAEILEPYARHYGVAILNTRGFAVEYAKRIVNTAKTKRANVFLLTDWDIQGLWMGKKLPQFQRIGINHEIIRLAGEFCDPPRDLTRADVEETYLPDEKHLRSVLLSEEELAEVTKTRVEIDAVLAEVGPRALWEAIKKTMTATKVRDLTRSIEPQVRLPDYLAEPLEIIQRISQELGNPLLRKRLKRLQNWRGKFREIEELEKQIEEDVKMDLSRKRKLRQIAPLLSKAAKLLES